MSRKDIPGQAFLYGDRPNPPLPRDMMRPVKEAIERRMTPLAKRLLARVEKDGSILSTGSMDWIVVSAPKAEVDRSLHALWLAGFLSRESDGDGGYEYTLRGD